MSEVSETKVMKCDLFVKETYIRHKENYSAVVM